MKQKQLFGTLLAFLLVLSTIASAFAAPPFDNSNPNNFYGFNNLNDKSNNGQDKDSDLIDDGNDLCPFIKNPTDKNVDTFAGVDQDIDNDDLGNLCDPNNYDPYVLATSNKGTGKLQDPFVGKEGETLVINLEGKYGGSTVKDPDVQAHHGVNNPELLNIPEDPFVIGFNAIPLLITLDKLIKDSNNDNTFDEKKEQVGMLISGIDQGNNKKELQWTPDFDEAGMYVLLVKTLDGGDDLAQHDKQRTTTDRIFIKIEEGVPPNECPVVNDIVMNPNQATVGEPVTFSALFNDADGDAVSCTWEVDGAVVPGVSTCTFDFTFTTAGDHSVKATASDGKKDNDGNDCAKSLTKTFKANEAPNSCPTGQIEYDIKNPEQGDVINFNAINVVDAEGDAPVACTWEINNVVVSNQCSFQYTVPDQNDLHVELYLSDGSDECAYPLNLADEEDIPVEKNQCPVVEIFPKVTTVVEGDSVTFTALTDDPQNDQVSCTWEVDNQVVFTNQAVNGVCTFTAQFNTVGQSAVTVTVTDNKKDAAGNACEQSATAVISVNEKQPPANLCPTGNIQFTPEKPKKGDTMTFTAVNINDDELADESVTCTWEVNDKIASNECTFEYTVTDETQLHVELYLSDGELECLYPQNLVDEEFIDIVIEPGNLCPVAPIFPEENPLFLTKGATQEFVAQFFDPDQKPEDKPSSCLWQVNGEFKLGAGANGCTLTETFDQVGQFTVAMQLITDQVDENNEACAYADSRQVVVVEEPNSCPVGKIDYTPKVIKVGDDITFTAVEVTDAQGDAPITCTWEVNDQKVSDQCTFTLQDAAVGDYHVELFLADAKAACAYPLNEVAEVDVTVPTEPEKQLCTAILDVVQQQTVEPATVEFSCENSNVQPKGTSFTCAWDLGDGSAETNKNFKHQYALAGNYHVGLKVTTADGTTCNDLADIKIQHKSAPEEEPREALELIQADLLNGEFYCPGEDAELLLTLQNIREDPLEDLKTTVYVTDLNAFWHVGEFNLKVNEKKTIFMPLHVPDDADPGEYIIRVYAGNDDLARIIHRRLVVEKCQ
ncbi:PKD domain-containing protein [Candidatus Woesearchaeota archaeon]|nr:PKD domain-containing protein [Candidatus Woesearchaeota archaeon]